MSTEYYCPDLISGKRAIVTGGTAGIGRAIALQLAYSGADVVILGTNAERGAAVVKEITEIAGRKAHFFKVDISKTKETEEVLQQAVTALGGNVDILVNNAGITRDQLLMKMSEDDWDAVLDTNVKSCYNASRAVIRSMMKARAGCIINISSIVGIMGNAGQINYAASKAAIIGFTKALAKEVAGRGIRVNCVCPGLTETAMTEVMTPEQKTAFLAQIPLGRMGIPSEIAHAVLMLASPLSSYMTGQVIVVDGGLVM